VVSRATTISPATAMFVRSGLFNYLSIYPFNYFL
jgi:hypothetical protein